MDYREAKPKVNEAFKALRKAGYFARQNFWCCSSCAWADIAEKKAAKAVFYHSQSNERFVRGDDLYLYWDGNGHEIARILEHAGLKVEWDGSPNRAIVVKLKD